MIAAILPRTLHQQASHPGPPQCGFDEQSVQFGLTIITIQNSCEPKNEPIALGNEDLPVGDLAGGNHDRIRVVQDRLAITGVRQRGSPLQGFQALELVDSRHSNRDTHPSHAINLASR